MIKRKKRIRQLDMFNQILRNRSIEDATYYRHGINVNDYDSDGYNSFFYAINAYADSYDKIKYILDNGGDPNISMYDGVKNGGELWKNVPIYELIFRVNIYTNYYNPDNISSIKLLFERGAKVPSYVYDEIKPEVIEELLFLFDISKTNQLLKL